MLQIITGLQMLRHRLSRDAGAVTIEYGVLTVFIALALIVVVGVLVGGINTWFGKIATFISGQPGG